MLDRHGFDAWADEYEDTVAKSRQEGVYPFAGYEQVLDIIYREIKRGTGKRVLDVGIGTGTLAKRLYDEGYTIYGLDFSQSMLREAEKKMPEAVLVQADFSEGLPDAWREESFDYIVCTYAIHHLDAARQIELIRHWMEYLPFDGKILLGDVAFSTWEEREACRKKSGDEWDEEEIYPVAQDVKREILLAEFRQVSFCAGVFRFPKEIWSRDGYVMRPARLEDAEMYYQENFNPLDGEVARLTGSKEVYSREEVVNFFCQCIQDRDRFDFLLISPDGSIIGESVINDIDWTARCANFRIAIFHSWQCGKGIGSWAVNNARDFAFQVLGLHRLELDVFSFNPRAKKAYLAAGFAVEGVLRDRIWDGEKYGDDIIMAILEDEWKELRK